MVTPKKYFLDSDAVRYYFDDVPYFADGIQKIIDDPDSHIYISETVREETVRGLESDKSTLTDEQTRHLEERISVFPTVLASAKTEKIAEELSKDLQKRGQTIGKGNPPNDVKIAAMAMRWEGTLITNNIGHMGRIRGLEMETFIPERRELMEQIREAHDRAELKIGDLKEQVKHGEMAENEFDKAEKRALREMDGDMNLAIDNHKEKEKLRKQEAIQKEESQQKAADLMRVKAAAALEAIRVKSRDHDRERDLEL